MKALVTLILLSTALCHAAEWRPQDIHPKVFQMVDSWISDTSTPVVTEINLDAVRMNRNQFDYVAVRTEDGWITFRDDVEMLRFKLTGSSEDNYSILYQENGGGSLTTERAIQFTVFFRKIKADGLETKIRVLHVLSIERKPEPDKAVQITPVAHLWRQATSDAP
jgi:hypothetical protein